MESHTFKPKFIPFFVQGMLFGILFGLSLVLIDEGFTNFNTYTFLLALPFAAIVGVVVTLLVMPLLKARLTSHGIEARDSFCRKRLVLWENISDARLFNLAGIRYVRVFEKGSKYPLWVCLALRKKQHFLELLSRIEPREGKLKRALSSVTT